MPTFTREEIEHLGDLARIALTDEEITRLQGELNVIADSINKVQEVAGDDVPPTANPVPLEAYLRHERPLTSNRSVFVRCLAPHDAPVSVDAIHRVIRDAFSRAGIPHGRAHALRHTLACRLVNSGGSIKEVADVLRHRSLNTSLIYAKTDRAGLVEVALPWAGSPA